MTFFATSSREAPVRPYANPNHAGAHPRCDVARDQNPRAAYSLVAMDDRETARQRQALDQARENDIKLDPLDASLDDLAWLAGRIERRLRKDFDDEFRRQMEGPEFEISKQNDKAYLDFVMRLLPAKAALEAAHIQDQANRELVKETKTLATWTVIVAVGTVGALIASVLFWVASLN